MTILHVVNFELQEIEMPEEASEQSPSVCPSISPPSIERGFALRFLSLYEQ
jgi:hypothetical protein